jgi:hypothetical protein
LLLQVVTPVKVLMDADWYFFFTRVEIVGWYRLGRCSQFVGERGGPLHRRKYFPTLWHPSMKETSTGESFHIRFFCWEVLYLLLFFVPLPFLPPDSSVHLPWDMACHRPPLYSKFSLILSSKRKRLWRNFLDDDNLCVCVVCTNRTTQCLYQVFIKFTTKCWRCYWRDSSPFGESLHDWYVSSFKCFI